MAASLLSPSGGERDLFPGLRQHHQDHCAKLWQFDRPRVPNDIAVKQMIFVTEKISDSFNAVPPNLGMGLQPVIRQGPDRLGDNFKRAFDGA
jgi:hypothetical protein